MERAWATMDAGSLLLAGSMRVVPALAMLPKAFRYCSAMRMLAASLPPSALHHTLLSTVPGQAHCMDSVKALLLLYSQVQMALGKVQATCSGPGQACCMDQVKALLLLYSQVQMAVGEVQATCYGMAIKLQTSTANHAASCMQHCSCLLCAFCRVRIGDWQCLGFFCDCFLHQ